MARLTRPRVLIRTLPLSAGNYGGILQAWALQRTLECLGAEPVTDCSQPSGVTPSLKSRAERIVKAAAIRSPFSALADPAWYGQVFRKSMDIHIQEFADTHVRQVMLYRASGEIDDEVAASFDAFLAGSDQIWRAKWGNDVVSYLFDFLKEGDPRPRASYAASFGRSDIDEYPPTLQTASARLAQRLTAVSVREKSGVAICEQVWGVQAEQHLDPTLLLRRERYAELIATAEPKAQPGSLVSYILDRSTEAAQSEFSLARLLRQTPTRLTYRTPASYGAYRADPLRYARPKVEQWLDAIASASLVITDSFHGTVFAILNNTPFITITNTNRGASRFESLMSTFGLQHRLLRPGTEIPTSLVKEPIDWANVNRTLDHERHRSITYLRRALNLAE